LPPPARRPKLMIGANKPRMLSIALPHVDAWNTWFTHYDNTAEGFAEHSAYVLVEVEPGAGERRRDVPAVAADGLAGHLRALEQAGADEAILVLDPITEPSIRALAAVLR